jgi:predicted ATP-grasp superfamily ATP-dependent carboligase
VSADNPPVVLLGGESIALSIARSLGPAGIPVYALGNERYDPVRRSRHCTSFVHVGSGEGVQARCLDWLERGPGNAVVLPCNDDGLELVARHRTRLVELGYVPIEANDEVLLAMLDKRRTYALAGRLGIATPKIVTVRDREALDAVIDDVVFPCALKPVHSHHFSRHFGVRTKVFVTADRDQLVRTYQRLSPLGVELMITEIVPGRDDAYWSYYSYLDHDGKPLFHFTKQKLRQFPTGFGLSCYQVTRWDPEVAEEGLRFFQGVGLRGIGNVEFKRDERNGRLVLIECNHRFTAANEVVRIAGIDLARITYDRLLGREVATIASFKEGIRMWHTAEDIGALLELRRRGELTIAAWFGSLLHRQHVPVFRWSDPRPALFSWRVLSRRVWRKLKTDAPPSVPVPSEA